MEIVDLETSKCMSVLKEYISLNVNIIACFVEKVSGISNIESADSLPDTYSKQ